MPIYKGNTILPKVYKGTTLLTKVYKAAVSLIQNFTPSGNFEIVTYTGNGGTQSISGYINKSAVFNGSSSTISTTLPNNDIESFSFWMYFVSGTTNNRPLGSTVGSSAGNLSVEVGTNGAIACNIQNLQIHFVFTFSHCRC